MINKSTGSDEERDEREFGTALITVVIAAVFFAAERSDVDGVQEACFHKAESFVKEAVKRYGKQLNLT